MFTNFTGLSDNASPRCNNPIISTSIANVIAPGNKRISWLQDTTRNRNTLPRDVRMLKAGGQGNVQSERSWGSSPQPWTSPCRLLLARRAAILGTNTWTIRTLPLPNRHRCLQRHSIAVMDWVETAVSVSYHPTAFQSRAPLPARRLIVGRSDRKMYGELYS